MTPPVIGVFDSGFGGLTVLAALLKEIPAARYVFLGDTARLPYGSKSQATIARYAASSARFLAEECGADYLEIACNTASAVALPEIEAAVAVPVLGVIEPGAEEAARRSSTAQAAVLATQATVESHAYRERCRAHGVAALEKPCPLLVPLVEEGWIDHPVTAEVISIYLRELAGELAAAGLNADTLVLGCTHYPLLRAEIQAAARREIHPGIEIIDSAAATARRAAAALKLGQSPGARPTVEFFATDSVEKFSRLGSRFLGRPLGPVRLVDLGG